MAKVIVIGGGIIGLLSAFELHQRGQDVTVIEKGDFCRGASSGNAGWVTPSLSGPVPAPGIVADSLKWMLKPDSPLYVRPASVPKMAGWLLSFWRYCSEKHYVHGLAALSKLNETTMDHFDSLVERGLRFEMHRSGLLYVFRERSTLPAMEKEVEQASTYAPIEWVKLSPKEARELEPALREEIAGAIKIDNDRHVRPESLLESVYTRLKEEGVVLLSHTEVVELALDGARVVGVRTGDGVIQADQVLIATGAETGTLLRKAGFDLPMQAGKGYSVTMKTERPPISRSMYLVEDRVALTPFQGAMRIAGTMELSGINTTLHPRRIEAMVRNAGRYLKEVQTGEIIERWVGMRPMLPDGLPAIGRIGDFSNLFVAAGHAMLGVTLGPTTAVAIAELMTSGRSPYDLAAFSPNRFRS